MPIDLGFGCVAMRQGDSWVVLAPNNKILKKCDDEYEARNEAMYRNLTATTEEMEEWQSR